MTAPAWRTMPPSWQPAHAAIDCVRLRLDAAFAAAEPELTRRLPQPEQARAAAYRSVPARLRFVGGRVALRALLACAGGQRPCDVRIDRGEHGAPTAPGSSLDVNLTHAGEWVMAAVSQSGPVGVDIEPLRGIPEWRAIAEHFHAEDRDCLASIDAAGVMLPFLRVWTRKEAVAKALGLGLALPLDACAVGSRGAAPCRSVGVCHAGVTSAWSLFDVDPEPGYIAAIAVRPGATLMFWSLRMPLLMDLWARGEA